MKKFISLFVVLLGIFGIVLIYKYTRPIDDTKKLFIKCNGISEKYDVMINDIIEFASDSDVCKLNLEVENIDRDFIKINSNTYFYKMNGKGELDKLTLSYDVYVSSDDSLYLIGHDKETRFEFCYK